ncbi:MAG: FecR domain-containing protein [Pseudomonadota bacterium]
MMRRGAVNLVLILGLIAPSQGVAEPVTRTIETTAEIVTTDGDEDMRLQELSDWIVAETKQRLAPGDELRTGRYGAMALRFDDRTLVRLHANSELRLKERTRTRSVFDFARGALWGRALAPKTQLQFDTPAVSAAIRGTDWYLAVDANGETRLSVLDGAVDLTNDFGSLTVRAGESAFVRPGEPPRREFIVEPPEGRRWVLRIDLGWLELVSLSGLTSSELRATTPTTDVSRAERLVELGDLLAARPLAESLPLTAESALVKGVLATIDGDNATATTLLQRAEGAGGRRGALARLVLAGLTIEAGEPDRANGLLSQLNADPHVGSQARLMATWLEAYGGRFDAALKALEPLDYRGYDRVRAHILEGQFHTLLGDREAAGQSFAAALDADPGDPIALNYYGLWLGTARFDFEGAMANFRQAIELNPSAFQQRINLGMLELVLGNGPAAKDLIRQGIEVMPSHPIPRGTLAAQLAFEGLTVEARDVLAPVIDDQHPDVLRALAYIAQAEGDAEAAAAAIERALVANPGRPGIDSAAGIFYWENRQVAAALEALNNAERLDPLDPEPLLLRSVIGIEEFDVPMAVEAARKGLDLIRHPEGRGVRANLNALQSGINNVGAAYARVGLAEWAGYYGDVAANPFSANTAFFRGSFLPNAGARLSSISQGLLLEPLAVYEPNGLAQFVRRSGRDVTLVGRLGENAAGGSGGFDVNVTGFAAGRQPTSYFLNASVSADGGPRDETDSQQLTLIASAARQYNETDSLLIRSSVNRLKNDLPGPEPVADADDQDTFTQAALEVSWSRRNSLTDRWFVRSKFDRSRSVYENGRPFGEGLTDLDNSLIGAFDVETARFFYDLPIFDGSDLVTDDGGSLADGTATDPFVVFGAAGPIFGLPVLNTGLGPEDPDLTLAERIETKVTRFDLQAKRLKRFALVDVEAGVEAFVQEIGTEFTRNASETVGTVRITTTVPPPTFEIDFARILTDQKDRLTTLEAELAAYAYGTAQPLKRLKVHGGATGFYRFTDLDSRRGIVFADAEGEERDFDVDPRLGLALEISPSVWLRVSAERQSNGLRFDSLIPQGSFGLVPSDTFYSGVGEITSVKSRIDAEVTRRAFVYLETEYQDVDNWSFVIPGSNALASDFSVPNGTFVQTRLGANLWLGGPFGFALEGRQRDSRVTDGPFEGEALPLLAETEAVAGLTYYGPPNLAANLSLAYVGERPGDLANSIELDSHVSLNAGATWVSDDRGWSVALAGNNLLNSEIDQAPGFPAAGASVLLRVERRF